MKRKGASSRLRRSALFGQPLIFDFSWQHTMRYPDLKSSALQTATSYVYNRHSDDPFDFWFVNIDSDSPIDPHLREQFPLLYSRRDHLIHLSERSYLDLFPNKRLVYLCPHVNPPLKTIDPDEIYIIGALRDQTGRGPRIHGRAMKENIRVAGFPLKEHLSEGTKIKSIPIHKIVAILHRVKQGESWKSALEACIPAADSGSHHKKLRVRNLLEE